MGLIELLRRRRNIRTDAEVRHLLGQGPWCWPEEPPELVARAQERHPGGPPAPRPGDTLISTVGVSQTCLFRLTERSRSEGGVVCELGTDARYALDTAQALLPTTLPLVWRSVREAAFADPVAQLVARHVRIEPPAPVHLVDGASCGLSMYLALASRVLGKPIAADTVAIAAITASGRLLPVDDEGLEAKLHAVAEWAPAVRRIVVHAEQARLVDDHPASLVAVGVRHCQEALAALGWAAERLPELVLAPLPEAEREELCESLVRLVLQGRATLASWAPVHAAAQWAFERWKGALPEPTLHGVLFARAVAGRHEGMVADVPMPPRRWLDELPGELRLEAMAHLVQHVTDVGPLAGVEGARTAAGAVAVVRQLLEQELPPARRRLVAHIKVQGAVARLLAACGELEEALGHQREAARGYVERMAYAEGTYPLSEWYRIAGLLRDNQAFEEAETYREHLGRRGGLGQGGSVFVEAARLRSQALLGREPDRTAAALRSLAGPDGRAPAHIRFGAVRWLVQLVGPVQAKDELTGLEQSAATARRDVRDQARVQMALLQLDAALREHDEESARGALERFAAYEPSYAALCTVGLHSDAKPLERAACVCRFYPY